MNIQDRVTINHVYIKPDAQICACVLPVPDKPQFSALERLSPATQSECNKIIELHEQALKACKESAVLFEDQKALMILGRRQPDTFYQLDFDCEVEIIELCAKGSCAQANECIDREMCAAKKVARLIPEAKEEKTIEAGRILALKEAQKFLHDELGDDWNDLCQTLYEGRILAAMYKFKCYEGAAPIVEESQLVAFGKWLKHVDNGTHHYNPFTGSYSESIGFSPLDCFTDDTMSIEELVEKFRAINP